MQRRFAFGADGAKARPMTKPAPKEWILGISPYVPGKAAADDGRPLVKLSANENPLGTSDAARAALVAATADLATYPDPGAAKMRLQHCMGWTRRG
jgi:histidinol-phosphate aminotransferase